MALVKVRWVVTEEHEAEIEIDGFDPDDDLDDSLLAEHENDASYQSTIDRGVLEFEVVREGEAVAVPEIKAPQHEPEWGDDG